MEKRCQKFTPSEYVRKMLETVGYSGEIILKKTFLENSCGPGNVLCEAVRIYIEEALKSNYTKIEIKKDLEHYFIGFEIDYTVMEECRINLDSLVSFYEIDSVEWNLQCSDYLKTELNQKVDYIVGNPPYIRYQELDNDERIFLRDNFISCKDGKFDYCYPFIEKSLLDLDRNGHMAYLIPSSIFKNAFGKNIRMLIKKYLKKIIDFKHTKVFSDALTSPAMIFLDKGIEENSIEYIDYDFKQSHRISKNNLNNKWIFDNDFHFIHSIRNKSAETFGDYFKVGNSVATLKNDVFVIKDYEIKNDFLYTNKIRMELSATRPAASPRGINLGRNERIIFPYKYYRRKLIRYTEEEYLSSFPETANYLLENISDLNNRKADGKWFEYGRIQALSDINQRKLIMSSIITEQVKLTILDKETIPYSGFYIVPKDNLTLKAGKEILESRQFLDYIHSMAINANGKSVRISVNDIKKYPLQF